MRRRRREVGGHGPRPVPPFHVHTTPGIATRTPAEGAAGSAGAIHESDLPNGIQVLSERIPGVRSVAVGVWVRQGAAHEAPRELGASHLLEHMVFKGTGTRSARDIALSIEALGGSLDAYTSREHTSFQARVLDEHLDEALDVLTDLVLDPALRDDDLELEREVVLEEISTVDDTPDDLVFELHGERLWGAHPYGHSILGTRDTVASVSGATLRELHGDRYVGSNLVVAAAGNVDHEALLEGVVRRMERVPAGRRVAGVPRPPRPGAGDVSVTRESAQTHLVFGADAPAHADPRRYALVLLSQALGGGMSSRLFQKVREELALAYTVFTYQSFYSVSGVAGVYVGTRPAWAERAVDAVREELARVAREGLPADELEQTKQQVKGQIMLSLESTGARLYRLAGFALYDEPFQGLDDVLARVDAVTPAQVAEVAGEYFDPHRHLLLRLGPEAE